MVNHAPVKIVAEKLQLKHHGMRKCWYMFTLLVYIVESGCSSFPFPISLQPPEEFELKTLWF